MVWETVDIWDLQIQGNIQGAGVMKPEDMG